MEVAKLCQSLQAHKKHGNYAECMASGKDKEIVNLGEQMSRQSKKFRDDELHAGKVFMPKEAEICQLMDAPMMKHPNQEEKQGKIVMLVQILLTNGRERRRIQLIHCTLSHRSLKAEIFQMIQRSGQL